MQASLPRFVRMVSVEDVGQGSESIRILGVTWLPTGAAAKSVSASGDSVGDQNSKSSDREVPGEGQVQGLNGERDEGEKRTEQDQGSKGKEEPSMEEGFEAEEGDFFNMEVAFAYRTRSEGRNLRNRARNPHLLLAFYLPAGIKVRK